MWLFVGIAIGSLFGTLVMSLFAANADRRGREDAEDAMRFMEREERHG